jgi:hypothetical protein
MGKRGMTIAVCVGIGTAIGVATNQVATWAAIGAGLALVLTVGKSCFSGSCEPKQGEGK